MEEILRGWVHIATQDRSNGNYLQQPRSRDSSCGLSGSDLRLPREARLGVEVAWGTPQLSARDINPILSTHHMGQTKRCYRRCLGNKTKMIPFLGNLRQQPCSEASQIQYHLDLDGR